MIGLLYVAMLAVAIGVCSGFATRLMWK